MDVSYQVAGASWRPTYDVRVEIAETESDKKSLQVWNVIIIIHMRLVRNPERAKIPFIRHENEAFRRIQIVYAAQIRQSTGEDWNDASLSLSTAQPNRGGTVPELATVHAALVTHANPPPVPQVYAGGHALVFGQQAHVRK